MKDSNLQKIKQYTSAKNRLYLIDFIFSICLLVIFFFSGLSIFLKNFVVVHTSNFYFGLALYFTVFALGLYLLSVWLNYYDSFIIEHKFNLSQYTKLNWLKDNLKKNLVSFVFILLVIELFYFFLKNFEHTWWLFASISWFFISVILVKIVPVVILPIFYKQKPLQDNELKQRLINLSNKANRKIENIFTIDLSKETKKANAALVGSGKTRRILLSDTLLEHYSNDEIEVILAHELGHYNLKHIPKLLITGGIFSFIVFYFVYILFNKSLTMLNLKNIYDIAGLPILMIIFILLSTIIKLPQNAFSRKLENEADKYALQLTSLNDAFISAMQKLTKQNLSDPNPSKIIELLLYDHPPVSKRIKLAETSKIIKKL